MCAALKADGRRERDGGPSETICGAQVPAWRPNATRRASFAYLLESFENIKTQHREEDKRLERLLQESHVDNMTSNACFRLEDVRMTPQSLKPRKT